MALNSSLFYLERFANRAGTSLSSGARILDAGSGEAPYRKYFAHAKYESIDFCNVEKKYEPPTFVGSLENIPVPSDSYDLVLCTQVLEHVPEPAKVLNEFNRILNSDGKLWLSVPFYYPEHEIPFDYYRYTQFGLNHLLDSAGFKVIELEWLEGYWGTVGFQLEFMGKNLPVNPIKTPYFPWNLPLCILMWAFRLQCRIAAPFFYLLDRFKKRVGSGHPKNYTVIAVKKDAS